MQFNSTFTKDDLLVLKNLKNALRALLLLAILLITLNVRAAGKCLSDKSDIREDTQKIMEKLTIRYGSSNLQKATNIEKNYKVLEKIYDEQELKVDRSDAFLKQVNSVGVVTNGPAENPISYGTAVLVSPCHVFINAHAIVNQQIKDGQSPILISLGQNTCASKNEFAYQDIKGQVVASGNAHDQSSDYAIVRIPKISDIEPALIATEYILKGTPLLTVGFPYKSTFPQTTGFRYPTANFSKAVDIAADGTFGVLNTSDSAGGSGSGVFIMDDDNGRPLVFLAGIHRSQQGRGLQTAAILEHLKANNLKIYNELANSIRSKSCN